MTINRNTWSTDERHEYDALLSVVIASSKATGERLNLFEKLLDDAVQAGRVWATDVDGSCRRDGLGDEIRRYQDRNRAMVSYKGEVLNVPSIQSTKTRSASGDVVYQRELIELTTWEQIAEKRAEAIRSRRTYSDKIAHYDKLLALRDLCPESTTPADAAKRLGLTVDGWLSDGGEIAA